MLLYFIKIKFNPLQEFLRYYGHELMSVLLSEMCVAAGGADNTVLGICDTVTNTDE